MFTIQHVKDLSAFKEIKTEWEALEDNYSVFQSWLWNYTWAKTVLQNNKKYTLDIHIISENSKIRAILPFFYEKYLLSSFRLYHFLGHRMSFHNDILVAPETVDDSFSALITFFMGNMTFNSVYLLRHIDENSQFTKKMAELNCAEPQCNRLIVKHDPELPDQSVRFKKESQRSYRKNLNNFKKKYDFIVRVKKGVDAGKSFKTMIDLHTKRKQSQGKDTLLEGDNLSFMNELMKLYENIDFEVIELFNGEEIVASRLMIKDSDSYYCINGGFDPKYYKYSPMKILLNISMERGFNELGCQYFDFGPGYEKYKYAWNPEIKQNYFSCFGSSNFYAKAIAIAIKKMFLRKLPPDPR